MENRLEQPNAGIKKELHDIYVSVYKSSLPITKKERILNSIFGYENWSSNFHIQICYSKFSLFLLSEENFYKQTHKYHVTLF